jgi:hypothetical protein
LVRYLQPGSGIEVNDSQINAEANLQPEEGRGKKETQQTLALAGVKGETGDGDVGGSRKERRQMGAKKR